MKKSKFTEAQVAAALRECASGAPVGQVARKFGVSEQTLYTWKKKYASLDTSDTRKVLSWLLCSSSKRSCENLLLLQACSPCELIERGCRANPDHGEVDAGESPTETRL